MSKKMFWGLGALIILLLGTAFVFITVRDRAEIRQLKKELAEYKQMLKTGMNPPFGVKHMNPYDARPDPDIIEQNYRNKPNDGYEYVWHGDHWCRVEDTDSSPVKDDTFDILQTDLPDELPAEFPTDEELQQMSYGDLNHLMNLYREEALALQKTDYDAGVKLHNTTVPKLWERILEISEKDGAGVMERHKERLKKLPIRRPATEELPEMIIEAGPRPNEGGKQ